MLACRFAALGLWCLCSLPCGCALVLNLKYTSFYVKFPGYGIIKWRFHLIAFPSTLHCSARALHHQLAPPILNLIFFYLRFTQNCDALALYRYHYCVIALTTSKNWQIKHTQKLCSFYYFTRFLFCFSATTNARLDINIITFFIICPCWFAS